MLSSIEKASEATDHSMAALVKEIERLQDTVQVVERKVYSFWRWELPKKSILTTGILAILLMVVLIGGKQVTWGVGLFSGFWGKFYYPIQCNHLILTECKQHFQWPRC